VAGTSGVGTSHEHTELWDRCFPLTVIKEAFEAGAADLPRYAAGQEIRPICF